MRCSNLFFPTLKEDPSEAETASHRLLLRAGFIRRLAAGVYSYLPLGLKTLRRIENIVREEMDRAGAQELLLPMVQPADLWQESGRWEKYGPELLRFQDRNGRASCLGPTHEEVITDLVRREARSYRDLPLTLYQIQTKFRDEIRPRFGIMRGREFLMKDAYSFAANVADADAEYWRMHAAYIRIFTRLGLRFRAVEADTGSIGGSSSHEFMVLADTGEDTLATCTVCNYAANIEKARVVPASAPDIAPLLSVEEVATPEKHSVADVCDFLGLPPDVVVKTTIWIADGRPVAVLVRGDREVQTVKLQNLLAATDLRLADDAELRQAAGVEAGFVGPVGLRLEIITDAEVAVMKNFVTGAGKSGFHLKNVNCGRDFVVDRTGDIRQITSGDPCPDCGGAILLTQGIEVGHIFKLGTVYSQPLKAVFLDSEGQEQPMVMGCYGIGVSRIMAAAIEQNHDANGMILPLALAPFHAVVLNLLPQDKVITAAAEDIVHRLGCHAAGPFDVLIDDRDDRPGSKFKDADLIGIPYRITVGKKFVQEGVVELRCRRDGSTLVLPPEQALEEFVRLINADRAA